MSDNACSSRFFGSPSPMRSAASAFWRSMISTASAGVRMPHIFENVFMLNGRLYSSSF